jgi:peptidoglycan hydrolase-like protein with peptidoglycan-binding domain
MKKDILILVVVSMLASVSAQTGSTCLDLSVNLVRGAESVNVLKLQNFLHAKGLLKATPNGYFGPGTLAAVKSYQRSLGLSQVGNTGPATRAAIKKESCASLVINQIVPQTPLPTTPVVATSTSLAATTSQASVPMPVLYSLDLVTLFAGGQTDWTFDLHGNNFSSTTNTVLFKNTTNRRTYTIGTFISPDTMTITLPKNIGSTVFSCGTYCNEALPAGTYEVSVMTSGGQTDAKTLQIQSFTSSVQTGAIQGALPSNGTKVRFGTITFSPGTPVIVQSVAVVVASSTITSGGYANIRLIDQSTNGIYENAALSSFQSKIIDAYVDTNNTSPSGEITAYFMVVVQDYIGKKNTVFMSAPFLVTIAGIL